MTEKRYAWQAVKAVPAGTRDFAGNMKRREGRDIKEKIIPLLLIDWLESMNPADLDKRSDMTGVRCEMSTVDQRDDEWQVWFLIGAAIPNGGFYVITDKPSKTVSNPLRQVRKAGGT